MQTQNRLLDDLARVATGALGVAAGMRDEIEFRLRDQFEKVLAGLDLVTREEFDAVKAMAAKARAEQETLAQRVAALEAQPGAKAGTAAKPKKAAKKSARKGTAQKT
ncbi:MAG: accessory factor UbiK family protein [Proteobacteria bacterium]|nr:accessory factor UbiK family protein [Pseudomonadota bacterium]